MKQAEKLVEESRVKEAQRNEEIARCHLEECNRLHNKFREEIDPMKAETQQFKIKIAELNVILKNDQQEITRLQKDNERMCDSYKKLQVSSKDEIKRLEQELRKKFEEGDKKVRDQLEISLQKQSLESATQQMQHELEQCKGELVQEKAAREESQRQVYQLEKDLNQALADLEFTQIVIRDHDRTINNMDIVNRDNLSRIAQFSAI